MPNILSTFFSELNGLVNPNSEAQADDENLLVYIETARREWSNACSFFNQVSEPDLVDMAIYSMDAAEKKYMYLLKMAKVRGMQLPGYPEIEV